MFTPKRIEPAELDVRRVEIPCPEFNWFLHQAVGVAYRWGGREDWDRSKWLEYVNRPELETWAAYVSGAPAGYFELEQQPDGSARIHCFGLCQAFLGKGLGGHLLSVAVERAWELSRSRVWLTSCNHDHPHALPNYLARGFQLVKETQGPANRPRSSLLFGGSPA